MKMTPLLVGICSFFSLAHSTHADVAKDMADLVAKEYPVLVEAPIPGSGNACYVTQELFSSAPHTLYLKGEIDPQTNAMKIHAAKVGPGGHHFGFFMTQHPLRTQVVADSIEQAFRQLDQFYKSDAFYQMVEGFNFPVILANENFMNSAKRVVSQAAKEDRFVVWTANWDGTMDLSLR